MNFYKLTNKSFEEHGVSTYQELWAKVKSNHKGFCMSLNTEYKSVDGSENRFKVVMSTDEQDRHGDIVRQNWDLTAFRKNPVFLDSHQYDSIEHIIGKVHDIRIETNKLVGEVEFMLENPKGLLAFKMVKGGFLNATSVGFIPKEFNDKGEIIMSELLEDSAVSVPALSSALFEKKLKDLESDIIDEDDDNEEVVDEKEKDEQDETEDDTEDVEEDTDVDEDLEEDVEEEDEHDEKKYVKIKENKKLTAIKNINSKLEQEERKRKELLKESLGVIRQLQKTDIKSERKRMVNRVIRQMLKAK